MENEIPLKQQMSYDQNVEEWQGNWFSPVLRKRYMVPINSANHHRHRGCVGTCIGRRASGFGMSWALIEFDDEQENLKPDIDRIVWIRTIYLVDAE